MSQFVGWEGDRLVVRFRYRADLKDQVKAIQGARFEWDKKYWWFSKADALAALPALERAGFDVSAARAGGDETIELPPEPEHVGICALNAEVARALSGASRRRGGWWERCKTASRAGRSATST